VNFYVANDNHSSNETLLQCVTALFYLLRAGCSTLCDQTRCSDLYSHFNVYMDSFWYTSDLHVVTICPVLLSAVISRRRRNRFQLSIAWRWQLALRRRLLQVTCQPGASWEVERDGNHYTRVWKCWKGLRESSCHSAMISDVSPWGWKQQVFPKRCYHIPSFTVLHVGVVFFSLSVQVPAVYLKLYQSCFFFGRS